MILITDKKNPDLQKLNRFMKDEGLSNLYLPKKIKFLEEFPILGSGKIDFKKLQDIANS